MPRQAIEAALNTPKTTPHAGLLITRGAAPRDQGNGQVKGDVVDKIALLKPDELYKNAYNEWEKMTRDKTRFGQCSLTLANRLYIGVNRDNTLETGISLHHTYGMPLIPGSACKGLARHVSTKQIPEATPWLFGEGSDDGETGELRFHDAWWVPNCTPFVAEIITPHHSEYYSEEGGVPATDFDSPIPAPQIATRGSFLFVLEGRPQWVELGMKLLQIGLTTQGIGGKRSSGYGYFNP